MSVVIPTLNAAETLGATLASLGVGLELVVVDGGSSDRSVELARAAGAHVVRRDQVIPGIAEMIHDIQVEATFPDGTKLVTVHEPIR